MFEGYDHTSELLMCTVNTWTTKPLTACMNSCIISTGQVKELINLHKFNEN